MSSVAFIAMHGFRVREGAMLELGMRLPGLGPRARAIAGLPALGLLTLAGMTPGGWEVSYFEAPGDDAKWSNHKLPNGQIRNGGADNHGELVVDESTARFDARGEPVGRMAEVVSAVLRERPRVAAISALSASIEDAYLLSRVLRREGVRTVMGGLHVTACPDEAIRFADAAVVGDGEASWGRVLSDALAGEMRGVYRAERAFDLALSPVPRFELVGRKRARYTVQTQRGCPLACEFCGASRLLGGFREKPAACVARELEEIVRVAGKRAFVELADDNTFAGKRDVGELLGVLAASGVRYFTEADWRIGERPELLRDLAASGCVQVLVGFESLVHRHGGMGAKGTAHRRMLDACLAIQDAGVAVIGCFIVGADGETHESLAELGGLLAESPLADVQVTMLTAFAGTELRVRMAREGRLIRERGWSACTLFDATFVPDRMTVEELERGFWNVVKMAHGAGPAARRAEIRRKIWGRRNAELLRGDEA